MVRKLYPLNWSPLLFILFIRAGAEKIGPQTSNDFDAVAVKGLKTAQGINDQVQLVHDIQEGVPNNANNVNDLRDTIQDTGALSEHGTDWNATNKVRHTSLHIAATHGELAAVRLLVEHGADVRVQNDGGWTPLAEATVCGYFDIAQLLLEPDADVHVQNNGG